jgi:hypothetical protein
MGVIKQRSNFKPRPVRHSSGFLLGLLFYPENGGDVFLRSVGISPIYMALQTQKTAQITVTAVRTSNPTISNTLRKKIYERFLSSGI